MKALNHPNINFIWGNCHPGNIIPFYGTYEWKGLIWLPGRQRLHDGEGSLSPVQAAGTSGTGLPAEGHCPQGPDTGGPIVTELNIKLADFRLSSKYIGHTLVTFCGSLSNEALELFLHQIYDDLGVDVWSLGVVLYRDPAVGGGGLLRTEASDVEWILPCTYTVCLRNVKKIFKS